MTDSTEFWASKYVGARSEDEVRTRLVQPLLRALGWPQEEIHENVPVRLQTGRRVQSFPADIVLAEASSITPTTGWVVVEAKKPDVSLDGAAGQAFSYAYGLKTAFFATCNGIDLEIWQTRWFQDNTLVLKCAVDDLKTHKGEIESILSRPSVLDYCEKNKIRQVSLDGVDISGFIDSVNDWHALRLIERQVRVVGVESQLFISSDPSRCFTPEAGRNYYISGWGGRGKTSALRCLALAVLSQPDKRLPLLLDAELCTGSLWNLVADTIGWCVPQLASPDSVRLWLNKKPDVVIVVDNWHRCPEEHRRTLSRDLHEIAGQNRTIVLSSRPNIPPSNQLQFVELRIEGYSRDERLRAVEAFLELEGESSRGAHAIVAAFPTALRGLMYEPILLNVYLEGSKASIRSPTNVPELVERMLERLVASDVTRVRKKMDELAAVFEILARGSSSIFLASDVQQAIEEAGLTERWSEFADQMTSHGLWCRVGKARYSFVHEFWRCYFRHEAFIRGLGTDAVSELRRWVHTTDQGELKLSVPIAAGLLDTSELQDALFTEILRTAPELYFDALLHRTDVSASTHSDESRALLEQILRGYVDLVELTMPAFKPFLNPWKYADEQQAEQQVVIGGVASRTHFAYQFGFPLWQGCCERRDKPARSCE